MRIISGIVVIGLVGSGIVSAQTEPQAGEQRTSKRVNAPTPPVNNDSAERTGAMLQRTDNSLLAAQLAAKPDPSQVKTAQVSFLAVPKPEPKTLKRHDLVTIIINEQSEITSKGTNNFSRDTQFDAKINNMVQFQPQHWTIKGLPQATSTPEINLSGQRNFQGQGEVDRADSFTAQITAEVVDVKPNGTVILQARKRIKTDEEEQQFVLTGTCRAEDITALNTVLSTQMFDLELQKNHKGDVRQATKRGLLGKLFDIINPF